MKKNKILKTLGFIVVALLKINLTVAQGVAALELQDARAVSALSQSWIKAQEANYKTVNEYAKLKDPKKIVAQSSSFFKSANALYLPNKIEETVINSAGDLLGAYLGGKQPLVSNLIKKGINSLTKALNDSNQEAFQQNIATGADNYLRSLRKPNQTPVEYLNEYNKAKTDPDFIKFKENYKETFGKAFDDAKFESFAIALSQTSASNTSSAASDMLKKVNKDVSDIKQEQKENAKGIAELINGQQKAAYAVELLNKNIDKTKAELTAELAKTNKNVEKIAQLTLRNSMDIQAIKAAVGQNTKDIIDIKNDVKEIKAYQLLDRTPIAEQIKLLEKRDPRLTVLYGDEKGVTEQIEKLEAIKFKQDIATVANDVSQYGTVALQAMNTFNIGSPQLRKVVGKTTQIGNIVASFASGNPIGAVMGVFGLFGKDPGPSPEQQMLTEIKDQLKGLEDNMNQQFKQVHEQFRRQDARFDELNYKIDFINKRLDGIESRLANIELELNKINVKLDYIIRQNNNIDDKLTLLSDITGVCFEPNKSFLEFKDSVLSSFANFKTFYENQAGCALCLEALNKAISQDFRDAVAFDYSTRNNVEITEGNLLNEKKIYDKLIPLWETYILKTSKAPEALTLSLLFPPSNTKVSEFLTDKLVEKKLSYSEITYSKFLQNKSYKNYKKIVQLSEYLVNFYSFLELVKNNTLRTPEEYANDRFGSSIRSKSLQVGLKNVDDLISQAIMQQSLISGHTTMSMIKDIFNSSDDESIRTSLSFLESNPYLAQNLAINIMNSLDSTTLERVMTLNGKYRNGKAKRLGFNGLIDKKIASWFTLYINENNTVFAAFQKPIIDENKKNVFKQVLVELPYSLGEIKEDAFLKTIALEELLSTQRLVRSKINEMYIIDNVPDYIKGEISTFNRADLAFMIHGADIKLNNLNIDSISIQLKKGWNIISSYIQPTDSSIENIIKPIASQVLFVKNGAGLQYIPSLNVNDIKNWDVTQGYQIKLKSDAVLTITGEKRNTLGVTIPIKAGWQIVSCLSAQEELPENIFNNPSIITVKNNSGAVYIPTRLNSTLKISPTQGYQVKARSSTTITFPNRSGNQ